MTWRTHVVESIDRLFHGATLRESRLYGRIHAEEVEAELERIASPSGMAVDDVCRAAALLHDVGYARRSSAWSSDDYEHIQAGVNIAKDILATIEAFDRENKEEILQIVEGHDDSTYSYPSAQRIGGEIAIAAPDSTEITRLSIIRDADARVHSSKDHLEIQLLDWGARDIRSVPPDTRGATPPVWNDSIMGNLRLLAKRALKDSCTEASREKAWSFYEETENRSQKLCNDLRHPYSRELFNRTILEEAVARLSDKPTRTRLLGSTNWGGLCSRLYKVPLDGAKNVFPYRGCSIDRILVDLAELLPMSKYIIEENLEDMVELHDVLLVGYGLCIYDLPGLVSLSITGSDSLIAPPIVEVYSEPGVGLVKGLVDGLHRVWVSRELGYGEFYAAVIRGVEWPLVPRPVNWDDVISYRESAPPNDAEKRDYRYKTVEEVESKYRAAFEGKLTAENAAYFFFRELGTIGSRGRRRFKRDES